MNDLMTFHTETCDKSVMDIRFNNCYMTGKKKKFNRSVLIRTVYSTGKETAKATEDLISKIETSTDGRHRKV